VTKTARGILKRLYVRRSSGWRQTLVGGLFCIFLVFFVLFHDTLDGLSASLGPPSVSVVSAIFELECQGL
jgi:hypothetical protein